MNTTHRLFFALSLPEETSQQIIRWRAQSFPLQAGRPVAAANLHLTLAFLGEVSERKAQQLQTLAGRIHQPGFTLTLDDAGHWPRPGVVWLGCRHAPRGLLQLAELLRSQAARNGCYQSPQPFHPHITLLRAATRPVALPAATFRWTLPIQQFTLYESRQEEGRIHYHPRAHWPLTS
ncbi:RNA 2',3'-cyclic phosphodiesterase [Musicola keenii]|uniref:RNA 2',3'-cyclic phosphodiesterase n=1 Tax=Musicola keenii TaxID=2884250 RepID=UPI00177BF868|nr:RNA 2',3'-cyclic phosphodiesterase [Musicola keenii]